MSQDKRIDFDPMHTRRHTIDWSGDKVAIPALSYPLFLRTVSPSSKNSLSNGKHRDSSLRLVQAE